VDKGVLPALTSRLKIDRFINIAKIENKRVELISSSEKAERERERENRRVRERERETGFCASRSDWICERN
jgi:hypothetical protein